MNKEIIHKVLNNQKLQISDITQFVTEYIKLKKGVEITSEQLNGIVQLILSGHFNLQYAAEQAALHFNIYVCKIIDIKTNEIIKIYTYE